MNKLGNYLMFGLFVLFIFGFGILSVVSEDRPSSFWENRTLTQKPVVTKEGIIDGSYMSAFETYFTDQFPIRDGWMKTHMIIERMTNQSFVNNYHETDEHYLLAKPMDYFATDNMQMSVNEMNALGDNLQSKGIETFFFYLPSRIITLEDYYPEFIDKGYTAASKDFIYDNIVQPHIQKFDFSAKFLANYSLEERKEMFYQTDHHWNEIGALKGYEEIHNTLAEKSAHAENVPFSEADYERVCANQLSFLGSYNLQLYKLVTDYSDQACNFVSKKLNPAEDFTIHLGKVAPETKVAFNGLFGSKMNNESGDINYAEVFMQDYAEVNVINEKLVANGNDSKALIIKDSFANAINFLVAENFAYTTILDIRYFTEMTIEQYIEQNELDTVMILYNGETIFNSMYNFRGQY